VKPVPFEYHAPTTILGAIELLCELSDARVLAGGQSLVPMLNLRAATPGHLVDLAAIPELRGIEETPTSLRIGPMTTQREIERSDLVRLFCPLLFEAIQHVGHQQTRNRGTIGGSICHLDPGAEMPVVASALEASMTITGRNGSRTLPFSEFPAGYLTTILEPDEILTGIEFAKSGRRDGSAFLEFNQRPADFAVVSVAVTITLDGSHIESARIAVGGIDYAPMRLDEAEAILAGRILDDVSIKAAAAIAAQIHCEGDEVSPAEFRQHLAGVLVGRALNIAANRAMVSING
jgi:carbon-monoxide dehydrogenase medium subunit